MRVTEGGIELEVPGESTEGIEETVFYNPRQELNRDLTIAVLRAFREREPRAETYLDAMTASGIRGLRAAADGWDVTCCDRDPAAVALARENRDRNGLEAEIVGGDVRALLYERGHGPEAPFDVVDLDPYGTPIPFADAGFATARNLVCVTATDTAPLCGAHLASGIRSYAAVPRNTDYHAEMGVRILLSALARTAARYDVGVTPLFTHATSHYVRTYLELDHRATAADGALESLGHLYHCEDCLHREADYGLHADPIGTCPNCAGERILAAGPVWLDAYRDREFVADARAVIEDALEAVEEGGEATEEGETVTFGAAKKAIELCGILEVEVDEPTHYDQHRLCKEWSVSANSMADFLADLRDAGYEASRAHYGGTTFKTDATVAQIRKATAPSLE